MIKKINKISKFAIFDNFKWSPDLPKFKKFNILYGWNWTGKTTLSRVFQCYESGLPDKDFSDSHFELELDNGVKLNQQNLVNVLDIRVFNKFFIHDNISWEGTTQPIYFIGKENITLEDEIVKLKAKKKEASDNLLKLKEQLQNKNREKEKRSINTAKNIKDNLITNLDDDYRFYDKTNFNNYIQNNKAKLIQSDQSILTNEEFKDYKQSIIKEIKEKITEIPITKLDVPTLIPMVNHQLSKSITSSSIKKLSEDWEINSWVKDGLEIHKKRNSLVCEFCGSALPRDLINKLEAHFSNEYNKSIESIEALISKIENQKIRFAIPDSSRLYADFQKEFLYTKSVTENAVESAHKELDKIITKLKTKKQKIFQIFEIDKNEITIDKFDQLYQSIQRLNQLIEKHNTLTDNFDSEITKNRVLWRICGSKFSIFHLTI